MKGPTLKAGPSRDTIITDSVENQLEDFSSYSEKGEWEIIRRKVSCPIQGDEDEEVLAELEDLPMKNLVTAKGVVAALNKGFEME